MYGKEKHNMEKRRNSSIDGKNKTQNSFRTVDQAFAHFFPANTVFPRKTRIRESGTDLAERVFSKVLRGQKRG
jgi:hypothetical protein